MHIKVGETLISKLTIDVQYRCSRCGRDNRIRETVTGQAETSTIFGINTNRHLVADAHADLVLNLAAIADPKNPDRYRKAAFTCRCKRCGHMEPWARMNYERLRKPSEISLCIFICCSFLLFILTSVLLSSPYANLNDMDPWLLALTLTTFIVSLGVYIGIRVYKKKNSEKMEKLIAKLPEESLPHILPH